jgi:hypothetical protein
MPMISVDGTNLPAPSDYQVSIQDVDSAETKRTETGILSRDRVRAGVYKIQVTWRVKKPQLRIITDALKPAEFSVTFFDPTTGSSPTKTMYCGDRVGKLLSWNDTGAPNESLWELTTSLIEY